MSLPDPNHDPELEARLRSVPLPDGLLGRLRLAALIDDDDLDAAVRSVPVPAGLTDRLQRSILLDDAALDAALCEVPLPAGVMARWQHIARPRVRLTRLAQFVTTASLLIAITLSYGGMMAGFLVATYPWHQQSGPTIQLRAQFSDQDEEPPPEFDRLAMAVGETVAEDLQQVGPPPMVPVIELVDFERGAPGALEEVNALFASAGRDDLFRSAGLVLGGFEPRDGLRELEFQEASMLAPKGLQAPLGPGYAWWFLNKYGVHPFVSPLAHERLRTSALPLRVGTSSYELTSQYLAQGELPQREEVRIEEFLAAVDYDFPDPGSNALGLTVVGGPSPYGGLGWHLLQVGVQARRLSDAAHRPVHLVLAVDTSASMGRAGRLAMVRRALRELVGKLGPDDRLSLVTFSQDAQVLVEEAGPDDADRLRTVVDGLVAQRFTNLGAGLWQACELALQGATFREGATRVVLLSDGQTIFEPQTADVLERRLAEAADRNVLLEVIDVGWSPPADGQLGRLAEFGGGKIYHAVGADEIRVALAEILSGRSQRLASDVELSVHFNPKAVLWYRLIGHEAGPVPADPSTDFHCGQSATGLYEIHLRPQGAKDVATAVLRWRDPGSGELRQLSRTIRRGQFAPSFVESAASLQVATLVAETAEILRGSRHAPVLRGLRSPALARVLFLAEQVDTQLRLRPSFTEFVALVKRAEQAKPYLRGGSR